jgi:hypothetical protein
MFLSSSSLSGRLSEVHVYMRVSVAVPPAPVRIPSKRPLASSVASVTNDNDNEMIPGAVHRCTDISLTVEENPRKPQLGDRLMKVLCDQ